MQSPSEVQPFYLSPTTGRLTAAAGFVGMTGAFAAVAYFDPSTHQFFPVCPLYAMTGFACPGCGLTRGFHALFHGDVMTALDFNALILVWAVILLWVWSSLFLTAVRGRGLPMWPTRPNVLWTFFIALMIFGVLRNIPVYPLTVLFP